MSRVCVLLPGPIEHDGRVIRTVRTMESAGAEIDLFHTGPAGSGNDVFGERVRVVPVPRRPDTFTAKLLRHTFFYRDDLPLASAAMAAGARYDVVWANDLPALLPAARVRAASGGALVYDSHEIFTETLNQYFPAGTRGPRRWMHRALLSFMRSAGRRAEKRMVRRVDRFITVNRSLAAYFAKVYGVPEPLVVMNCPESRPERPAPTADFRSEFGWSKSDRVFLYQGMLNAGRGLPLLIEALAISDERAKLVVLGDGPIRADLEAAAAKLGLGGRARFLGRVPYDDLPGRTAAADFGVNLLEDLNLSKRMASPNKLFEYIHAGLPVLCSATEENRRVLEEFDVGVMTKNDPASIRDAIGTLLESSRIEVHREACAAAARVYCWESQAGPILEILEHA